MVVPQWSFAGGPGVLAAHRLLEAMALTAIPLSIHRPTRRFVLPAAVVVGIASGFMVTAASTHPSIDVWYFLQQSAAGLIHWRDMYQDSWAGSPGITHGYTYMPWTTVVLVPFRLILGDIRYGLVCASAAGAIVVHRLARSGAIAPMLATLVFLVPGGLMLTESAWTEPLLFAYLSGCVLATVSGRFTSAVGCLALAVATKQYVWLLLPLFAVWRPFGLRRTVAATGAGFAISLPWVIAGPTAFWNGAIAYLYGLPTPLYSLSLSGLLAQHNSTLPFVWVVCVTIAALVLATLYVRRTANIAIACAAVLLVFNIFNHRSFFNQYWLVEELLVVGWALASRLSDDVTAPGPAPAIAKPLPVGS
jgi:hypothetical protein